MIDQVLGFKILDLEDLRGAMIMCNVTMPEVIQAIFKVYSFQIEENYVDDWF